MASSSPLYTESPHTQTNVYTGTAKHFMMAKHSVFNILAHRPQIVSTNQQALHKEMEYIRKALQACSFPPWVLNSLHNKFNHIHNIHSGQNSTNNQPNNNSRINNKNKNKNISIVVPYIHGLGERFKRTCKYMGIQVHFKGTNTKKTLLMAPKDRDSKLQKCVVIYKFKCQHIN